MTGSSTRERPKARSLSGSDCSTSAVRPVVHGRRARGRSGLDRRARPRLQRRHRVHATRDVVRDGRDAPRRLDSDLRLAIVTIDDPTSARTASGATGTSLSPAATCAARVTAGVSLRLRQHRHPCASGPHGGAGGGAESERACDFTRTRRRALHLTAPESFSFDSRTIGDGTHTADVGVARLRGATSTRPAVAADHRRQHRADRARRRPHPDGDHDGRGHGDRLVARARGQVAPVTPRTSPSAAPAGCRTTTQAASNGRGSATVALERHRRVHRPGLAPGRGGQPRARQRRDVDRHADRDPTAATTPATAAASRRPRRASTLSSPSRPSAATAARSRSAARVAAGVRGRVTVQARAQFGGRTSAPSSARHDHPRPALRHASPPALGHLAFRDSQRPLHGQRRSRAARTRRHAHPAA